jgi:protein gp37
MSDRSGIEWTEATWNPIAGCSIVSPGCSHCYAMRMAARLAAMGHIPQYAWTTKKVKGRAVWTGVINVAGDDTLHKPLHWKNSRMIFVNSMSDLFHEDVPWPIIDRVFDVMMLARQHTFQVLTKRAARMREYMRDSARGALGEVWPPPNVWLGVSAERQKEADERISHLLETPAVVRFVSAEPLLGPLDIHAWLILKSLDWIIVGGESGPRARPMHPEWARDLRDQCTAAGVPFFFKQWGEWGSFYGGMGTTFFAEPHSCRWLRHDGTWSRKESDGDARVTARVGKKAAGRLLDGRTWDEMPGRSGSNRTHGDFATTPD